MSQTPTGDVLVICPQAVVPAWGQQISSCQSKNPWRHQQDAANWALSRRSAMLALDMGTGKTLTALMVVGRDRLTPVLLGKGSTSSRAKAMDRAISLRSEGSRLVVVANYDSVWRGELGKAISKHKWSAIVLDESHRIKSPSGRASRWLASLARLNPDARLMCLTGTPMPHSPLDLYGQFRFLDPAVFGTNYARMRARYAECDNMFPSKVRRWIRQDELASILNKNSFRVTSSEVLDLPPVLHEVIPVTLSGRARLFYDSLEKDMVAKLESGTVVAANALTQLLRLQQATSGYAAVQVNETQVESRPIDVNPSKRVAFQEWLDDLPHDEPVVVFCRFRCDLREIAKACENLGRSCAELSGSSKDGLAHWQSGNASVLAVQIQSGGVGIDLTRASYCVYYSLGFSLGDYEQSLARLHRPGQTKCVRYYHLITENTVDEVVYDALKKRREVVEAVLHRLAKRVIH